MIENIHQLRAALVAFAIPMLVGCGQRAYKADPILISQYRAPGIPKPDETFVYVIRGRGALGSARGVWIAVNDRVVGALDNGTHLLLKLKSGMITVHGVQNLAGMAFKAVDDRSGETVFLTLNYMTTLMEEVPRDLGITMVMKTKPMKLLPETRENTGRDEGLLNPGRLGLNLTSASTTDLLPDANSAVITFLRSNPWRKGVAFDLWDERSYVGSLKFGEYLQVRVKPGRHTYFAKSERFSVLKADVVAGKSYVVEYHVGEGWNTEHVRLLPRHAIKEHRELRKQMQPLKQVALRSAALQRPNVRMRIDQANRYLGDARRKALAGELAFRELTADMGR